MVAASQDNNRNQFSIAQLVERAPRLPGCYLWKNEQDEILYVGKAVVLRSRLKSYLNPGDQKTELLMRRARALEWITTSDGSEALILEANLIKKYKPRYNIRLKDDKKYPYICVSLSEPFPRVFITRTVHDDGNRYFGPYTDVRATRGVLAHIERLFPLRRSTFKLPSKKKRRPCMNYHIKRCLGPCQGTVSPEEYGRVIQEIILFLEGRSEILENQIRQRMQEYSEHLDYEKAAIYRDMLSNIRRSLEHQSLLAPGSGDEDVIGLATEDDDGQVVVLEIRDGRMLGRKSFPLQGLTAGTPTEALAAFLRDYYLTADFIPVRIVLPINLKEKSELITYLSAKSEHSIKIGQGSRSEHRTLLATAERNARLLLRERRLAYKYRDREDRLADLQTLLALEKLPEIIECYDISHFQGDSPVASGVCFVDGEPRPSAYRRYAIRTISGINDPAMIGEVLARRLERLLNEDGALPDLIVIDGGELQLRAACDVADSLGVSQIAIIGLAKQREEIYLPGEKTPHRFDPERPALRLLRQLRDEAHRFGVTYHRQRRNRSALKTLLDDVPTVGAGRRKALLRHFRGKRIEEASREELSQVEGIGPVLAEKIYLFFHRNKIESS